MDFQLFKDSPNELALVERLNRWTRRRKQRETTAEATFISEFFGDTWGYRGAGQKETTIGFTLYPKFAIAKAGQKGGKGEADLALGWFGRADVPEIPQVVCEFKDIRSGLDAPQRRKGNDRSPVKQCLDYLWNARQGLFGHEPVIPTWAIVTDMEEFRLYWYDRAPQQFMRFVVRRQEEFFGTASLLGDTEDSRFERFLFWKTFHADTLLTTGGRSPLARLIEQQGLRDREIEETFYAEYRALRERLYKTLILFNKGAKDAAGKAVTKGQFVRLAQKLLDRIIFIAFCEDMGQALSYPPKLLRDFLSDESRSRYYDAKETTIWTRIKQLFEAMNVGRQFGGQSINRFNGGLFETDPLLDGMSIPNMLFCEPNQGQSEATLHAKKETVLYLVGAYNFASQATANQSISLYTLGHIFEQSTTELEILEAEADNRPSLNKINKRKRDGVYYTPEWIVERIIAETAGPRLIELRAECGWKGEQAPTLVALDAYEARLSKFTICDPACGSGAFLIAAVRYLLAEFRIVRSERARLTRGQPQMADGALLKQLLASNIYGVDINPASVEIAKLALWLHTARDREPLSALDRTIQCGNSLVDATFFKERTQDLYKDPEQRERVNAFDWWRAFPEVKARGGFDVVVGNPPYVKLQNFRQVHSDVAEFLREGTSTHRYESTRTGNFDLYLPFIERGIELLNESGRMGYIAPSLWVVNDYGEGLRKLIHRQRRLDRWVDFKGFQVFDEAITYTALQFFTKRAVDFVRVAVAPDGNITDIEWRGTERALSYDQLPFGAPWILLPGRERKLVDRLAATCKRLDNASITSHIFQGIITSADDIYHLKRLGRRKYLCTPGGRNAPPPYEVELEDSIMKPLVSGPEAKRYIVPHTDTFLLFPYDISGQDPVLLSVKSMREDFPKAWAYLRSYEQRLRQREYTEAKKKAQLCPRFDDAQWYRFGRPQNLNRQTIPKLVIAQTVPELRVFYDAEGQHFLNNVRVNGIVPNQTDPWFLLGVLNASVANYIFKRIAAPKVGGYFEANRQFVAPLPIPDVDKSAQRHISRLAQTLQSKFTERASLVEDIERRLDTLPAKRRPIEWLFPDLGTASDWDDRAPSGLDSAEQRQWVNTNRQMAIDARIEALGRRLKAKVKLTVEQRRGELRLLANAEPLIERVFVDSGDAKLLFAYWCFVTESLRGTNMTAERLCELLRKSPVGGSAEARSQIIQFQQYLHNVSREIESIESEVNQILFGLYSLTAAEVSLIERDGARP